MVDYFFYIFCFLSIYNIKLKGLDSFFYDYMKIENTNSIKGIFVWLIIFCHKYIYSMRNIVAMEFIINISFQFLLNI